MRTTDWWWFDWPFWPLVISIENLSPTAGRSPPSTKPISDWTMIWFDWQLLERSCFLVLYFTPNKAQILFLFHYTFLQVTAFENLLCSLHFTFVRTYINIVIKRVCWSTVRLELLPVSNTNNIYNTLIYKLFLLHKLHKLSTLILMLICLLC